MKIPPVDSPEPIKLTNVKISGFAASNARAGETVAVLTHAALTSDQPEFYTYVKGLLDHLAGRARALGIELVPDHWCGFLLVVHEDHAAELYPNGVAVSIKMRAKRNISAGQKVFLSDIADITHVSPMGVTIAPTDKVAWILKVGWKFAIVFDLDDQRETNQEEVECAVAHLYRLLRFQNIYETFDDSAFFPRLVRAGWFPFVELIGGDFEALLNAFKHDFEIEAQERALVEKFDGARFECMADRWWRNEHFASRRSLLESALNAFERGDSVGCIKTALTEIEGVLRDARIAAVGSGAKIEKLLDFAIEQGITKNQDEASLLFPRPFLVYLRNYTYEDFDPLGDSAINATRHAVGHGAAPADAYTQKAALQVLLTLDQISFYL
ncbi:hypothetical protein AUC70_10095 [Methyloceanibacter stevinii]|uniref:Uncharacterized protein n=1 Tax=Methyloceanibacter stevinii TaxID=1774970 RepID=A0A1E3VK94_9HYPH|nr:hypothetical protein [Methyloceanibacter stevinii]ODR93949.1 hypothetical protein AUC70_10095 [Methyloceanibacter stevinii]